MSVTVPGCAALWEHFSYCSCNRTVLWGICESCVCHSGCIPPALSLVTCRSFNSHLSIKFCMWGCGQEPHRPLVEPVPRQENTPKPWMGIVVPKGLGHDTLHWSSKKRSSAPFIAQISSQARGVCVCARLAQAQGCRAPSTQWVCSELPPAGRA